MARRRRAALVSDHAIVRWLERIEGHDFSELRKQISASGQEPTDSHILDKLAKDFGLFRGHVVYKIATKDVQLAIKAGAKKFNRNDCQLKIHDGKVVTIVG